MPHFAFPPVDDAALYWYAVDVERVVDGDTFVGALQFGFGLSRTGQWFRLAGIDTPERGQPGFHEATRFLEERIGGRRVIVCSHHDTSGRYRRIVCDVCADGVNVNEELLAAHLAKVPHYL